MFFYPKGVSKSTMLLQYIKENLKDENVLYVSLDDMWFAANSIMDLVEYHYVNGGTHLFIESPTYPVPATAIFIKLKIL